MVTAVMPTYARADVAFVRGEGAYIFDANGRRFLDFSSGIAVTALGHGHPRLVEAMTRAIQGVWHTSNLFRIPGQEQLADTLVKNSFADTVFFGNSGAEAVECGIKVVRKYQSATGHPERFRIITVEGAFHGRTLATLAAGRQDKHLKGFGPIVDGFDQVPFGDIAAMKAAIGTETAGILIEPIQGESGLKIVPTAYLQELRALCDANGLLLFFDEVQTGIGRTGKLFAHEFAGVTPDVMSSAKGLGGGFPIGACLATEKAAVGMLAGTHGSTFGGNPLATAAANAVLGEVLAPGFLDHVVAMGERMRKGLEGIVARHGNKVAEVRGKGLLVGLRCHTDSTKLIDALRANGLLTVSAGDNVIRLLPPLIVGEKEVDEGLAIIDKTLGSMVS